jgi:hypothetical protein
MAKKYKQPADVKRFNELFSMTEGDLQKLAKRELNKARVRLQRLTAWSGGKDEKLSYSARAAKALIEPYLNRRGNVSLKTKGLGKAQLINAIMRGESFNKMATSVKANKAALQAELKLEKHKGMTLDEVERRKRYWDIANKSGIFDFYDPSDEEEEQDVYHFILDAEEENMTDEEFKEYLESHMKKNKDNPFDQWGAVKKWERTKWETQSPKRKKTRSTKNIAVGESGGAWALRDDVTDNLGEVSEKWGEWLSEAAEALFKG